MKAPPPPVAEAGDAPLTRADVERLLADATEGEWSFDEPSGVAHPRVYGANDAILVAVVGNAEMDLESLNRHEADAALIAAAPDIARQLLASMEENEKMREALRKAFDTITYPVAKEINPRGYAWRFSEEAGDYAIERLRAALPSPPSPKG